MACISRIPVLALFLALAPVAARAGELTVVELFTSQGCSSCPPADTFLGELARRDGVLGISFHVDYWDYMGWKDPFADARHTRRQRDYVRRFGLDYVYTPQMVVNGRAQATGSDRSAVLSAIERARRHDRVPLRLTRNGIGGVRVAVGRTETDEAADLWLVVLDKQHETAVRRGENGGRTLYNYNVARRLVRIATWDGRDLETDIAMPAGPSGDTCAVILQSQATGHIIGAAAMSLEELPATP